MQVRSTGIYKRFFIGPTNALLEAMEWGFLRNKPFHVCYSVLTHALGTKGQLAIALLYLPTAFGYNTTD